MTRQKHHVLINLESDMGDWGPLLRNNVRQRKAEGSGRLFLALDDIWSGTQSQFQSLSNPHLLKDYFLLLSQL